MTPLPTHKMPLHVVIEIPHRRLKDAAVIADIVPVIRAIDECRSRTADNNAPVLAGDQVVVVPAVVSDGVRLGQLPARSIKGERDNNPTACSSDRHDAVFVLREDGGRVAVGCYYDFLCGDGASGSVDYVAMD